MSDDTAAAVEPPKEEAVTTEAPEIVEAPAETPAEAPAEIPAESTENGTTAPENTPSGEDVKPDETPMEDTTEPVEETKVEESTGGDAVMTGINVEETKEDEEKTEEVKEEKDEPMEEKPEDVVEEDQPFTKKRIRKGTAALIKEAEAYTTPEAKRSRKSLTTFEPEDYTKTPTKIKEIKIPEGRGTKLRDIPSVASKVNEYKVTDPILQKAYRLLYGGTGGIIGRGRGLIKKDLKKNLLEFSGYLPPLVSTEGLSEEEKGRIEEREDELEEKFATKAHQFKIPLLKSLCDLFDISRQYAPGSKKLPDKEGLVDLLLDFLGAPNASLTKSAQAKPKRGPSKSPKKTSTEDTPKKKRGRPPKKKVEEDVEMAEAEVVEEEDVDEVIDGKTIPSEKKLRNWVKAYVNCFNLEKATTNHAIETASDKFGVDLACKKDKIKDLLSEEMS